MNSGLHQTVEPAYDAQRLTQRVLSPLTKLGQRSQLSTRKPRQKREPLRSDFAPDAQEPLPAVSLHLERSLTEIAERYTSSIVAHCESLEEFSYRGTCRDDVRLGLRITNYKKRAVIFFSRR